MEIFDDNLNKVTFRTPCGKRNYESRKAYARNYLATLRVELNL